MRVDNSASPPMMAYVMENAHSIHFAAPSNISSSTQSFSIPSPISAAGSSFYIYSGLSSFDVDPGSKTLFYYLKVRSISPRLYSPSSNPSLSILFPLPSFHHLLLLSPSPASLSSDSSSPSRMPFTAITSPQTRRFSLRTFQIHRGICDTSRRPRNFMFLEWKVPSPNPCLPLSLLLTSLDILLQFFYLSTISSSSISSPSAL